jgi:hypothetical protein
MMAPVPALMLALLVTLQEMMQTARAALIAAAYRVIRAALLVYLVT